MHHLPALYKQDAPAFGAALEFGAAQHAIQDRYREGVAGGATGKPGRGRCARDGFRRPAAAPVPARSLPGYFQQRLATDMRYRLDDRTYIKKTWIGEDWQSKQRHGEQRGVYTWRYGLPKDYWVWRFPKTTWKATSQRGMILTLRNGGSGRSLNHPKLEGSWRKYGFGSPGCSGGNGFCKACFRQGMKSGKASRSWRMGLAG